ncbi:MAG: ribosome recycling factor [Ruminococcaceae bacterium]|nr:ribosome recycling factor [Oscillospiraceae bacterium]
MKERFNEVNRKMQRSVDVLVEELGAVRAGRANPAVLDKIMVEYYGAMTPINQIGSVSVPEPRALVIQPWDASALKAIEKAIQSSDLGINPSNDGKVIRLMFPQLTEERRRDLIKQVQKTGENAKVAVRNIRRDAMDQFKDLKKKSEITEDDLKNAEKEIQNMTDLKCKEIDGIIDKKEKELSEI